MKVFDLAMCARLGALALCLGFLTVVSTPAQNNANTNVGGTTRTVERDDDGFDLGWLGLLGLAGLAVLMKKPREVQVHDNRTTNR